MLDAIGPGLLQARPVAGRVGAAIGDVDVRDGLSDAMVDALHELLADRGVVIFTGQHLDVATHLAFARRLGEIRVPPGYIPTLRDEGHPEVGILQATPGSPRADHWHADVTWAPRPPRYAVAHMLVVPDAGGDTMWASQIEAYQRLSEPMRRFLEPLHAEHTFVARSSDSVMVDGSAVHPVVHRHPVSGRLALSVNPRWTKRIIELGEQESAGALAMLYDAILRPESICRWHWHPGDVAIWDNHFVLHYAVNDYDAPRTLHRIEIEGEPLVPVTSRL